MKAKGSATLNTSIKNDIWQTHMWHRSCRSSSLVHLPNKPKCIWQWKIHLNCCRPHFFISLSLLVVACAAGFFSTFLGSGVAVIIVDIVGPQQTNINPSSHVSRHTQQQYDDEMYQTKSPKEIFCFLTRVDFGVGLVQ